MVQCRVVRALQPGDGSSVFSFGEERGPRGQRKSMAGGKGAALFPPLGLRRYFGGV